MPETLRHSPINKNPDVVRAAWRPKNNAFSVAISKPTSLFHVTRKRRRKIRQFLDIVSALIVVSKRLAVLKLRTVARFSVDANHIRLRVFAFPLTTILATVLEGFWLCFGGILSKSRTKLDGVSPSKRMLPWTVLQSRRTHSRRRRVAFHSDCVGMADPPPPHFPTSFVPPRRTVVSQ